MSDTDPKYHVKFDFTRDTQNDLKEGVWTVSVGQRIIKAEYGLDPTTDNGGGDIRYETDDAATFAELLSLAFQYSDGGWWSVRPMPDGSSGVFHIPHKPRKDDD